MIELPPSCSHGTVQFQLGFTPVLAWTPDKCVKYSPPEKWRTIAFAWSQASSYEQSGYPYTTQLRFELDARDLPDKSLDDSIRENSKPEVECEAIPDLQRLVLE